MNCFFSKHFLLLSYQIASNAKGNLNSPACEMGLDSGFSLLSKFPNKERSPELV